MSFGFFKKFFVFFIFLLFISPIFAESEEEAQSSETEQSAENEEADDPKLKFNPIIFLSDILNDRYPLRVDFGAEPHRHGSKIFVSADYDWTNIFSQRIRLEYDHYSTSNNSSEALVNSEIRTISLTTFPLVLFFGDSDIKSKSLFSEIDLGFYINRSRSTSDTGVFFTNRTENAESGFQTIEGIQKYWLFGPALGYSMKIPFHKYFSATLEGFVVPICLVTLTMDLENSYYSNNGSEIYSESTKYKSFSSPLVRQSLAFTFFRYLRLKVQMTYQHLDLQESNKTNENIKEYSLHSFVLRYGGELVNPKKTRKKASHLWAGLYYELSWNKTFDKDIENKEHEGKWVLCFGT